MNIHIEELRRGFSLIQSNIGEQAALTFRKAILALEAEIAQSDARHVTPNGWLAERIDDHEIRVISPEGEAWRLRSTDRNDVFNNFIWRWATSMVDATTAPG